jgi:hypothetical protein
VVPRINVSPRAPVRGSVFPFDSSGVPVGGAQLAETRRVSARDESSLKDVLRQRG